MALDHCSFAPSELTLVLFSNAKPGIVTLFVCSISLSNSRSANMNEERQTKYSVPSGL